MTVSCIHTTTSRPRHQYAKDELFLWTDEACFMLVVCSVSTTVTSEDRIIMLSTNMGMKSAFGLQSLGTLSACLVPDRLTVQCYHDFLETVLLGLLEDVP
jgi:hypothetical protein